MITKIEKYGSSYCGPCKILDRTLEQMVSSGKLEGIEVIKYDVDDYEDLASEKNIRNVPVIIYYDENNKEMERSVGALPANAILNIIDKWNQ